MEWAFSDLMTWVREELACEEAELGPEAFAQKMENVKKIQQQVSVSKMVYIAKLEDAPSCGSKVDNPYSVTFLILSEHLYMIDMLFGVSPRMNTKKTFIEKGMEFVLNL
jgi:hypothetical protein